MSTNTNSLANRTRSSVVTHHPQFCYYLAVCIATLGGKVARYTPTVIYAAILCNWCRVDEHHIQNLFVCPGLYHITESIGSFLWIRSFIHFPFICWLTDLSSTINGMHGVWGTYKTSRSNSTVPHSTHSLPPMPSQLVWVITGTSSGIGRELTFAALNRGDKVIATARARSISALGDLKDKGADILELDVTSPLENLKEIAAAAVKIHGRVDVLVNNAGALTTAAILEDQSPEETLQQMNTNILGPLNVTRAFLPYMRERRVGTIIWIGSLGGWMSFPLCGAYCASKYAMRGVSQALHTEIAPLGLRSICIELGNYRTEFLSPSHRAPLRQKIEDYKEMAEAGDAFVSGFHGKEPGSPAKATSIIVDIVRGEGMAEGKDVPLVLSLGRDCYGGVKKVCEDTLRRLEEWKEVSISTDLDDTDCIRLAI